MFPEHQFPVKTCVANITRIKRFCFSVGYSVFTKFFFSIEMEFTFGTMKLIISKNVIVVLVVCTRMFNKGPRKENRVTFQTIRSLDLKVMENIVLKFFSIFLYNLTFGCVKK